MKLFVSVSGTLSLSAAILFLSGCSTSFDGATASPSQTQVGMIQGKVHGGQQPVVGAKVYLYATGTGGSGGNGIAAATANKSTSLLTSSGNTLFDGINYYVLTGAGGTFSITGDYTCAVGSQVYLYVVGGNPGAGTNSAAGFLAGLGSCPSAGNFAATDPYVFVNEVSTVVTAYSLAGYASDATHISTSGTTLSATGIANAMANVANLSNLATGTAYTTTHATGSAGAIPQTQIYTIADILAACVNSTSSTSTACTTLLSDDRSGGGQTGTEPTDTATAAIYLAQHPYSAYVSTLFNLIPATGNPFGSASTAPADYILAVTFTGNGITRTSNDPGSPGSIAIDGSGNVWVTNYSTSKLSAFNPLGVPLSGSPFSGNGLAEPNGVAIDTSEKIWTTDYQVQAISIFTNAGAASSNPTDPDQFCVEDGGNIAFDPSGNAWVSDVGGYTVCKINSTATTFTDMGHNAYFNPSGIASDKSGNIWFTNNESAGDGGTLQVDELNSSGTNINGSPFKASQINAGFGIAIDANSNAWIASLSNMVEITSGGSIGPAITAGGITAPNGVAVDGNNNIWETDYGTGAGDGAVIELNSSGTALSGSKGYQAGTTFTGMGIAVDGSGNIWVDNLDANSIRELVGAAGPVVTPLSQAVKNGQIATRP